MTMNFAFLILVLVISIIGVNASSCTYYMAPSSSSSTTGASDCSENSPCTTWTDLMAVVGQQRNCVVNFAKGTYDTSNFGKNLNITDTQGFKLVGAGATKTILDGGSKDSLFLYDGPNANKTSLEYTLKGMTFQRFSGADGAVFSVLAAPNAKSFKLSAIDCVFANNDATDSGGAIFVQDQPVSLTISGTTFRRNAANNGGALAVDTIQSLNLTQDCSFDQNNATSYGGAIWMSNGGASFLAGNFTGNQGGHSGGALYLSVSTSTTDVLTISGAVFETNLIDLPTTNAQKDDDDDDDDQKQDDIQTNQGGAIFVTSTSSGTKFPVTMDHVSFVTNIATQGAGIFATNGAQVSINSPADFVGNTATGSGGAVYINSQGKGYVNLYNATMSANVAVSSGAGVYCASNPTGTFNLTTVDESNISGSGNSFLCLPGACTGCATECLASVCDDCPTATACYIDSSTYNDTQPICLGGTSDEGNCGCVDTCGDHGTCWSHSPDTSYCKCDKPYTGSNCSDEASTSSWYSYSYRSESGGFHLGYLLLLGVGLIGGFLLLLGAAFLGLTYYRSRQQQMEEKQPLFYDPNPEL